MKYIVKNDLQYILKNKLGMIIVYMLVILMFVLINYIMGEKMNIELIKLVLGFRLTLNDIFSITFCFLNYALYLYLCTTLLYQDIVLNRDNLFVRMDVSEWLRYKLCVNVLVVIIINTLILGLLYLFPFHSINFLDILMKKIVYIGCLENVLLFLILIYKNNTIKIFLLFGAMNLTAYYILLVRIDYSPVKMIALLAFGIIVNSLLAKKTHIANLIEGGFNEN